MPDGIVSSIEIGRLKLLAVFAAGESQSVLAKTEVLILEDSSVIHRQLRHRIS